ncbi:hypothetical protein K6U06_03230 [Acidiferrimicrobium sp. IK]|uniref:DUF7065 domain-containing protein n=1 Tax=Acidiferrimicrobium sp. IK TaxID=2871700 RepID=UPI0021CAEFB7|nr:hypothetical protein [Acidiferrimicrobium sp. IK]MCU4183358.1 hypothetical protein [Acidiferrimicrobium sp. IK]
MQARPNLGTSAGGAFVYDTSAFESWSLPYFGWSYYDRLPETWDFDDVTFRNGVRVKMLEAGMRYQLGYQFRDQKDFTADLLFEGLTPPVPHLQGAPPFTGSSHYDQHGRVTGTLSLRGEAIEVDCVSVRDRSWGRRPELLGRIGRLSYAFGANDAGEAFLAFCAPPADNHLLEVETLTSGYLLRDGSLRRLASVQRNNVRDRVTGGVERIELVGEDTDGRRFRAVGQRRSAMALPTGAHVTINTFLEWEMTGGTGWGEDQDVWPFASFADRLHGKPATS